MDGFDDSYNRIREIGLIGAVFVLSLLIGFSQPFTGEDVVGSSVDQRELDSGSEVETPENVILIDIDSLRADHLGAYGYRENTSPHLDAFARKNIVFENALTPAEWTLPVAVSVFTSTYTRMHGISQQRRTVPESYTMLAEVLRSNGYETAAFTGGGSMADNLGLGQGFDIYEIGPDSRTGLDRRDFDRNFRKAASWLENNSGEKSFVFVHGYDVHAPYGVNSEYISKFEDNYTGPINKYQPVSPTQLNYDSGNLTLDADKGSIPLDEKDIEQIRAGYDSDVRHTDEQFGEFIARLKREGIYNDSAIIVYSSHGENLGNRVFEYRYEEHIFGHWYLWDHNTHVPLLIHLPGSESKRVSEPVSLLDLAPTIYDITGVKVPEKAFNRLRGESLLTSIKKGGSEQDSYAFTERFPRSIAIRGENWKLIRRDQNYTLYALDPEREVSKDDYPVVYQRLRKQLDEWDNQTPGSMDVNDSIRNSESGISAQLRKSISSFYRDEEKQTIGELLENNSVSVLKNYPLENVREGEKGKYRSIEAVSSSSESYLRATLVLNASPQFASDYIAEQRRGVEDLYRGTVPYNSKRGAKICNEEFRFETTVQEVSRPNITLIDLYSDDSRSYGACEDEAVYRSRIAVGYCHSEEILFHLNWHTGLESEEDPIYPVCKDAE